MSLTHVKQHTHIRYSSYLRKLSLIFILARFASVYYSQLFSFLILELTVKVVFTWKKILSLLSNPQLSHQIFELNSSKYIIINSIVLIYSLLYKWIFITLGGLGFLLFFYHNILIKNIGLLICGVLYLCVLVTERWRKSIQSPLWDIQPREQSGQQYRQTSEILQIWFQTTII